MIFTSRKYVTCRLSVRKRIFSEKCEIIMNQLVLKYFESYV